MSMPTQIAPPTASTAQAADKPVPAQVPQSRLEAPVSIGARARLGDIVGRVAGSNTWIVVPGGVTAPPLTDAPVDGLLYGRRDATWQEVGAAGAVDAGRGLTMTGTTLDLDIAGNAVANLGGVFVNAAGGTSGLTLAGNGGLSLAVMTRTARGSSTFATEAEVALGAAPIDTKAVSPLSMRSQLGAAGSTLTTVAKTVVPAINELKAALDLVGGTPLTFGRGLTLTASNVDLDLAGVSVAALGGVFVNAAGATSGLVLAGGGLTLSSATRAQRGATLFATEAQIATGTADFLAVSPLSLRGETGAAASTLTTLAKTIVPAIIELKAGLDAASPFVDAPSDGSMYGRQDAAWQVIAPGSAITADRGLTLTGGVMTLNQAGYATAALGGVYMGAQSTLAGLAVVDTGQLIVGESTRVLHGTLQIATEAELALTTQPIDNKAVSPRSLRGEMGAPAATLTTAEKAVVPAINEIKAAVDLALTDAPNDTDTYGRRGGVWSPVLPMSGGVLLGLLTLAGEPVEDLDAATKKTVADAVLAFEAPSDGFLFGRGGPVGGPNGWTRTLPLGGGVMSGLLTLSGAPTDDLHATTKLYVDSRVADDRYKGTYAIAANSPPLNPPTAPANGDRYLCVTADPAIGENPVAGVPGLDPAQTIFEGSFIIWDAPLAKFDLIAAGGMSIQEADARYLRLAGGTLTGLLTLSAPPTAALHAATKAYVDANAGGGLADAPNDGVFYGRRSLGWAQGLPINGGALTGPLLLAGDPTIDIHAATKGYVDRAAGVGGGPFLPLTGGTMTGTAQIEWVVGGGNITATSIINQGSGPTSEAMHEVFCGGSVKYGMLGTDFVIRQSFAGAGGTRVALRIGPPAINGTQLPGLITWDGPVVMTQAATAATPPTVPEHLTNKAYVDRLLADATRYQGAWQVAANVPDLTIATPALGDRYLCITADPNVAERAPAGLPGIGGTMIEAGDVIVWDPPLARWEIIHSAGLSKAEADAFYLQLAGGELTGFLTLHDHPTDAMHAVTKAYADTVGASAGGVLKSGDTMTGPLDMVGTSSANAYGPQFTSRIHARSTNAIGGDRIAAYEIWSPDDACRLAAWGAIRSTSTNGANQNGSIYAGANDSNNGFVEVFHSNAGGLTPTLYCAGPVSGQGAFVARSQRKLKDGIEDVDMHDLRRAFAALKPQRFAFKGNDNARRAWGFVVEDIEASAPEVIHGDGTDDDGKGYDVCAVLAIAVAELHRQAAVIARLEGRAS